MKTKLSVVLPVFNAQGMIGPLLAELLEVLPELTSQFELFVADDGSTDATAEMIAELSLDYPQMQCVHHSLRRGATATMHTALEGARGEYVLLCDEGCPANVYDIPKLWWTAVSRDLTVARLPSRAPLGWIPRLPGTLPGSGDAIRCPALQLTRRALAAEWSACSTNDSLLHWASRKGYAIQEVEIRDRQSTSNMESLADRLRRQLASGDKNSARIDDAPRRSTASQEPKRPNFLAKIKTFALGE